MSSISELGDVNAVSTLPSNSSVTQLESEVLDKDAFLTLLIAQFQNQDPLEPVSNEDMVLQLAQFSSIEATTNMNENLESYLENSNLATAASLMGKQVTYSEVVEVDGTEQVLNYMGTVDSILVEDGVALLEVDGKEVELSQVLSVSDATTSSDSE